MNTIHFCAIALVALTLSGCGKASSDEVRLGEFASLTGNQSTFGISSDEAIRLAVDEANASGGLLGKQVKLFVEDNHSKPGESATIVKKLIETDGVIAVLGEVASSRTLEAAAVCQSKGVPLVSPSSTNPKVTEIGDYIFRVCFIDSFQGTLLAHFAQEKLGKRIAILTDVKSDYSKGLSRFFKQSYNQSGGRIVAELGYNSGDKNFKEQLKLVGRTNAQALFIPGYYADVAKVCTQAKELGITIPVFGGDGWESEQLIEMGKEAVEGRYFSTHYSPSVDRKVVTKFVSAYRARYNGKTPDAWAALAYDSAMVLFDAVKRTRSIQGPKVRDAIASTKQFEGVTGNITINKNRDADKSAVIVQVRNGKFVYVESIAPGQD